MEKTDNCILCRVSGIFSFGHLCHVVGRTLINEMMKKKFEYFLNAIHYCLWLADVRFDDFMGKIVDVMLSPIPQYLFTKKYKKKYEERLGREQKNINRFFYDKETGYHIGWANHWYGFFYSGYPVIISFIFLGFILRYTDILTPLARVVIIGLPIGLCYIPAYRAVFSNDRYLMYFKHFEKKDERWHRKWRWITIAFCVGSVSCTVLGLLMAFAIAVL